MMKTTDVRRRFEVRPDPNNDDDGGGGACFFFHERGIRPLDDAAMRLPLREDRPGPRLSPPQRPPIGAPDAAAAPITVEADEPTTRNFVGLHRPAECQLASARKVTGLDRHRERARFM
jgi:hypothetical protein